MSTLSGTASKGEKTKSKYQSLDINSLYRHSRGENTEKTTQKSSSIYIKHGMQSLGKVPNARRAPANLPSLKSEHSGTDAAVPLVPPGATGWGKQDQNSTNSATQPTSTPTNSSGAPSTPQTSTAQPQLTSHQAAIALPVQTTIPPQNKQSTPPSAQPVPSADKLWSSVMTGHQDAAHPPLYQSPQFQHEFPSLSAGDGGPTRTGSDAQYVSGLSLRPQTEGSWTQGGQRPPGAPQDAGPPRQAGQAQLSAQAGQQPFPPQIRGVMPSFMYKGSMPQGGTVGIPSQQNAAAPQPVNGRGNRPPRLMDRDRDQGPDEVTPRPIIKEEELSKLDAIGTDMGWAISDDIDYNQKLAFSDDESERPQQQKRDREPAKAQQQSNKREERNERSERNDRNDRQTPPRGQQWGSSRSSTSRGRSSEEEDVWTQRRSQQDKEVELAIQRAKQRKEEEEKRFNEESKQRAAKKLMELDEKIRRKGDRDRETEVGTINPSAVPPKPINHVDIPLPDFQKEKERDRDTRSRTPNEPKEEGNNFRQLTQIEGKNYRQMNKQQSKPQERDHRERENGPSFSRHFQSDLPPRFLKHQRNNSNIQNTQQQQQFYQYDNNRWMANSQNPPKSQAQAPIRNIRPETPDREEEDRRDYKRQGSDDGYRSSHHEPVQKSPETHFNDEANPNYDRFHRGDAEKWQKDREKPEKKPEFNERSYGDDRRSQEKTQERFERPQRPDSRDSHSTRRSRDSEPRDYMMGSWNESVEPSYEEKRREHPREDRRQVPGPITKDRIEAEDVSSEKRNLTQLKRGEVSKKLENLPKKEEEEKVSSAWADSLPTPEETEVGNKFVLEKRTGSSSDLQKSEGKHFETKKQDDYKDRQNRNNRNYQQNKGWGSGPNDYHSRSSAWSKRPSRGHKPSGGSGRPPSSVGDSQEIFMGNHATDSDNSVDEVNKELKQAKNVEKDEKNQDNKEKQAPEKKQDKPEKRESYVPRGEPSRHGRGGSNNFRGSRMGGLSKRIDGYGPPPSKSPFGHHEDKEKKSSSEEPLGDSAGSSVDKTKQNQEALAAGIIGKNRHETQDDRDRNKQRNKSDHRRTKSRSKDEVQDTNSEHSDGKDGRNKQLPKRNASSRGPMDSSRGRNSNPPPRLGGDKRSQDSNQMQRQSSNVKREDKIDSQNVLANAIADITLKNQEEVEGKEENSDVNGDSEGFQEVKSKKAIKERQKTADEKKPVAKVDVKDPKTDRKLGKTQQLTQQQIQNIPSLMATPINPPPVLPQPKNQFERPRQSKLAPRFAKQKLQKAQMQQHMMNDVNDLNKVNQQSMSVYQMKENVQAAPVTGCAWDKPLGSALRSVEHDGMLGVNIEGVKGGLDQTQQSPGQQGVSPNSEKILGKPAQIQDKTLLDGSTPPVNTIIFENTNFKSAPGSRGPRPDKPRIKEENPSLDNSVIAGFNKPINELLQKSDKNDPIQLPLFKEDTSDMKLDFFGSDLSHLTDDKASKNLCISKSMHAISSGNSTICNADALNIKIASVKKVWETSEQEGEDTGSTITFGGPATLDPNVFKGNEVTDDSHEGYSPSPNQTASTTTNVCKVKPTQQVSGSGGQTVLNSAGHQQHSGIVAPGLMGNPLSPPPMQPVIGAGVGLGPQQYTTNQHISYQAGLGGSTQFGMSAIPSPPTVLYNSTQQQLQAAAAQTAGLYGAFQIDQSGVLGGQGRSQFSQYPNYHGLGQAASSPYSTQSVYLQTAPPHPPPTAQAPVQELYPNMNNYRLSATAAFGQNQQLNNPTTVLISSTSNSLMSASVKPSSQPISAIGTKAGGVGQAYQQQSQQGQQVYMTYDPSIQANYLSSAGVMQRGPGGPVQNNVVPTLQPSSSYYSGSTGGQTGYFQQPGNSTLQSAQMQQHQAGYGLQGNVFGTHSQSHTNTGLQGYNSHFLSTPMQVAAALTAQQFRSGLQNTYMKGMGGQQIGDQTGRPQQLKSPGGQEILSSVFNSGSQIPSPKSRQNAKHQQPPQSSPTSQRKYNLYQGVGGNQQQGNLQQRYPTPIQRPVNFQQNLGSMQQNNMANSQKHRSNNANKAPNRQYYGSQNNSLSSQNDKVDGSKLSDSNSTKAAIGSSPANVVNSSEMVKDSIKEETALKD